MILVSFKEHSLYPSFEVALTVTRYCIMFERKYWLYQPAWTNTTWARFGKEDSSGQSCLPLLFHASLHALRNVFWCSVPAFYRWNKTASMGEKRLYGCVNDLLGEKAKYEIGSSVGAAGQMNWSKTSLLAVRVQLWSDKRSVILNLESRHEHFLLRGYSAGVAWLIRV